LTGDNCFLGHGLVNISISLQLPRYNLAVIN
jgi:hypothetical protein